MSALMANILHFCNDVSIPHLAWVWMSLYIFDCQCWRAMQRKYTSEEGNHRIVWCKLHSADFKALLLPLDI